MKQFNSKTHVAAARRMVDCVTQEVSQWGRLFLVVHSLVQKPSAVHRIPITTGTQKRVDGMQTGNVERRDKRRQTLWAVTYRERELAGVLACVHVSGAKQKQQ